MVRIRLQRLGRTHRPFYRINAVDIRVKQGGKVLENLGWYDPVSKDESKQVSLKGERIKHWIGEGAKPSDTVMDLLAKAELVDADAWKAVRDKRVAKKKVKVAAEKARQEEAERKAAEAAAKEAAEKAAAEAEKAEGESSDESAEG